MFRWVIKQTAWKDATKVYNISGSAPVEIGELYNKAFGDDSVAIKFKEIKPNYLKFTFELDTGNATSESTSAKEIDTVEITPFNVVIDKDVIGAYKDHYTFESTPGVNVEYENGVIAGIDSNSVYGLIKSVNVTSSYDGDIIETTGSESSDSYVVPFVIPCEITSYLYKQAADLVISKDNNDIERKFWKDDFSVDSSSQYEFADGSTNFVQWSWIDNTLEYSGPRVENIRMKHILPSRDGMYSITVEPTAEPSSVAPEIGILLGNSNLTSGIFYGVRKDGDRWYILAREYVNNVPKDGSVLYTSIQNPVGSSHELKVIVSGSSYSFYYDGILKSSISWTPIDPIPRIGIRGHTVPTKVHSLTYSPSISYSDDFTTDTVTGANGRYQAVTGTVAYDDTNKRMNVTTAAGANGKASGRLKSYKFCEGAQQYDVTLPVGDDGDFICLVTHATNPAMTNGIGVGLQSDGAGNWNLATLSGTTVTVGASSGLTDGKTARIEIEKDITGAYWYYIYDAAGTKPTAATGKLYTTLSEGYTGWYANGNNKTYAIENISIRAESIVGRTNVEVTEPFWFRDEFGEDSKGRLSGDVASVAISGGALSFTSTAKQVTISIPKLRQPKISTKFSSGTANTRFYVSWGLPVTSYTGSPLSGTRYVIDFDLLRAQPTMMLRKYVAGVRINGDLSGWVNPTVTYEASTEYQLIIESLDEASFTITVTKVSDGSVLTSQTVTDASPLSAGYVNVGVTGNTYCTVNDIEISGTRVYNKPIHRGAMLGLYSTS
jgi:hypothetical protein